MQNKSTATSVLERLFAHPLSIVMVALAVVLMGGAAATQIEIAPLPDVELPNILIITALEGLPAEEIERLVTVPMESALSGIQGVEHVRSMSIRGVSRIELELAWGSDPQSIALDVRRAAGLGFASLPDRAELPLVITRSIAETPDFVIALIPRTDESPDRLYRAVETQVLPAFRTHTTVGRLRSAGAWRPEVHVEIDPDAAAALDIGTTTIASLISSSVFDLPVGTLRERDREITLTASTGVNTVADIAALPIPSDSPSIQRRLGDIARIRLNAEPATGAVVVDGAPAVVVEVYRSDRASVLALTRDAYAAVGEIRRRLGERVEIAVLRDAGSALGSLVRGTATALAIGIAVVTLLVSAGTRSASLATAVLAILPVSIFGTIFVLFLGEFTLNTVSITGFAVGLGLVVDGGIIVVNAIRRDAPLRGAAEVAAAVGGVLPSLFGSMVTTILVFIPAILVPGRFGALVAEFVVVIASLLAWAFVCAAVLTPAVAMLSGVDARGGTRERRRRTPGSRFQPAIKTISSAARVHWKATLSVMTLVTAVGAALITVVPRELTPFVLQDRVSGELWLEPRTTIEDARAVAASITEELSSLPWVDHARADIGVVADTLEERSRSLNDRSIVHLHITRASAERVTESRVRSDVMRIFSRFDPLYSIVYLPPDSVQSALGDTPVTSALLSADSRSELDGSITTVLTDLGSVWTPLTERMEAQTVLNFDTDRVALLNLAPATVLEEVNTAVDGRVVASIGEATDLLPIRVLLDPDALAGTDSVAEIQVPAGQSGRTVEVSSVVDFGNRLALRELRRVDGRPATIFRAAGRVTPRSSAPVTVEGDIDEQMRSLAAISAIALILVYLVLGAQFASVRLPLFCLVAIPLSLPGSVGLMLAAGISINLYSMIGLLVVIGTTINAAILLIAEFRSASRPPEEIVAERARTVAMTVTTSIATVLPIVLSRSPETILQRHTAMPIVGGLLFGTVCVVATFAVFARWISRPGYSEPEGR